MKREERRLEKSKSTLIQTQTVVEIGIPAKIQIELVQGNELRHYEIFFSLTSLSMTTAVGLWTGYMTSSTSSMPLQWSATAFTGLAIASGVVAYYYRSKMYNGKVTRSTTLDKFD